MIVDLQIEIKRFLESVYGLKVEDVRTTNYEGKRKRRKTGFYREIDYKKVNRRPNILTTAIDSPLKALCIWELHEQPCLLHAAYIPGHVWYAVQCLQVQQDSLGHPCQLLSSATNT